MTLPLIANDSIQLVLLLCAGVILCILSGQIYRFWRHILVPQKGLVDRINRLLPQTQCGQCGYEGCLPYARAIAKGEPTNQCPPGGEQTILQLSHLLNEFPLPLNPAHGKVDVAKVAFVREAECIGCTKCIKACPVDAIVGGAKLMHTVIAAECSGCDLCVAPCPVDCIDMIEREVPARIQWQLPGQLKSSCFPLDTQR